MAVPRSDSAALPNDTESRGSMAPLLPGAFPQTVESSKSSTNESEPGQTSLEQPAEEVKEGGKASKRPFWKLGKKTDEEKAKNKNKAAPLSKSPVPHIAPIGTLRPASPMSSPEPGQGSVSSQRGVPYGSPSSPPHGVYSSSPRLPSPASSQIFERNVQEEVVPPQASPQIPSHIITENHIPPALDASSEAITNQKLDPDSVEIVTHAMHQPAGVSTNIGSVDPSVTSLHEDLVPHRELTGDDNASNYGALDSADVRRLSFISFADVVHAEHAEHAEHNDHPEPSGTESAHLGSLSALAAPPRSPSPIRSPLSSPGRGTSPPTSVSPSFKGQDVSSPNIHRGSASSGAGPAQSPPLSVSAGGELNIETMSQALRMTGSGDLSGFRSQPLSAVGNDDGTFTDRPFK